MFLIGLHLRRTCFYDVMHAAWQASNIVFCRSDPVIEPMLQTVPDPFDSYGPPQSEDQIFSILSPLSIMTSTTPATDSPRTSTTPERDQVDLSSATNKITSWLPSTNGITYTPESTEWAKVPSPSETPPRSTSPVLSASPPANGPSRRHSVPAVHRKNESKLRSMLSVIEEVKPRLETEERTPSGPSLPPPDLTSSATPHPNPGADIGWNTTYGQSPYDTVEGEQLTPRNSTISPPHSPPPPPLSPSNPDFERHGPDDQVPITT